jgi:hypothetical protein
MNQNIRIFLFCPVPENQKPISEFLFFRENNLFNWVTKKKKEYRKTLFSFSFFLFFLTGIFLFPFFSWKISSSFLLFTGVCFNFFLFLFFFLLYSRWSQIENRLNNSRLFYEEGSWYDGQIWEKPFSLIKNERLVTTQKIEPILFLISRNIFFLFFSTIFSFFCYQAYPYI